MHVQLQTSNSNVDSEGSSKETEKSDVQLFQVQTDPHDLIQCSVFVKKSFTSLEICYYYDFKGKTFPIFSLL